MRAEPEQPVKPAKKAGPSWSCQSKSVNAATLAN
jgi:hypothetical protein